MALNSTLLSRTQEFSILMCETDSLGLKSINSDALSLQSGRSNMHI